MTVFVCMCMDNFMGCGLTSGGQELGSVLIWCSCVQNTCYIKSLALVPKDKRGWFSEGERSTLQLPLDHVCPLEVGHLKLTFG